MANQAVRITARIEHREKVGQQFVAFIFEREILLMVAHDGDQHLVRQREELGVEAAENDRRKLSEIHNRAEESVVVAPVRARYGSRRSVESLADALLAFGGADHNRAACQLFGVFRRPADLQRPRRKNAMTVAGMPGANAGELQRYHFAI